MENSQKHTQRETHTVLTLSSAALFILYRSSLLSYFVKGDTGVEVEDLNILPNLPVHPVLVS